MYRMVPYHHSPVLVFVCLVWCWGLGWGPCLPPLNCTCYPHWSHPYLWHQTLSPVPAQDSWWTSCLSFTFSREFAVRSMGPWCIRPHWALSAYSLLLRPLFTVCKMGWDLSYAGYVLIIFCWFVVFFFYSQKQGKYVFGRISRKDRDTSSAE